MMGSDMNDDGVEHPSAGPSRLGLDACRPTTRRRWLTHCTALAALACCAGLPGVQAATHAAENGAAAASTSKPAKPPAETANGARPILVLGDSLSAEYGLVRGTGWVSLLDKRLRQRSAAPAVVNASISGDTTSGGRSRLPPLLARYRPGVVILELGGNDALRGLPLDMTAENLAAMARAARASGSRVVVVGMQVPPNYGRAYSDRFAGLFGDVARSERAELVPFLLAGVADRPDADTLFQPDRIHPTASAHPTMLANVWPVLEPLLPR
jgi:acyl-CoA thioesterase I